MNKDTIYRQNAIDAIKKSRFLVDAMEKVIKLPSAQPETCAYWDRESNFCALHRPSAQPQDIARDIATIIENEKDMRVIVKNAQSEQRWIPVNERLPEGIGQVIIQTNGGAIHEVFYKGKSVYGHEVWIRLDGGVYWDDEVVAWMPLPEPYTERRKEDDSISD